MSTATKIRKPHRMIPTHPDWSLFLKSGGMHPDLCFLASEAVGHLVEIAGWDRSLNTSGSPWPEYRAEWAEWQRQPVSHSRKGEKFWDWWCKRDESYQDTPERACIAYVIAYRAWLKDHPEKP